MPDRKLTRTIKLADGRELRTIGDALEHALVLLATAAESGKRADIEQATDQLQLILTHARMV